MNAHLGGYGVDFPDISAGMVDFYRWTDLIWVDWQATFEKHRVIFHGLVILHPSFASKGLGQHLNALSGVLYARCEPKIVRLFVVLVRFSAHNA